jgi:hypothetical protein
VEATAFREAADKWYDLLEEGKVRRHPMLPSHRGPGRPILHVQTQGPGILCWKSRQGPAHPHRRWMPRARSSAANITETSILLLAAE